MTSLASGSYLDEASSFVIQTTATLLKWSFQGCISAVTYEKRFSIQYVNVTSQPAGEELEASWQYPGAYEAVTFIPCAEYCGLKIYNATPFPISNTNFLEFLDHFFGKTGCKFVGMILLLVLGFLTALLAAYLVSSVGRRDPKLPPGPPTLPIIGNLHQIPTTLAYLKFSQWAKQYGEIFSLKMGPETCIVLTSPRLVKQLIDKKSNIYSHRPVSYIGYDIISQGDHFLLMQYSDKWRAYRKLTHKFFMESMVVENHLALVDAEAVQMVRDFIEWPESYMQHPKRFTNSIIMSLVFGTRTPDIKATHMKRLYRIMENWADVTEFGSTPPVEIFPFIKYLPESWFGNWRTRAQRVAEQMNGLHREWLNNVVERRKSQGSRGCFMDHALDQEDCGKLPFDRHALYFLCGSLMEGGSDTTGSTLVAFIHAMTKWPSVMERAQDEIDHVVGDDRSPAWEDYARLPYLAACVKETLRWRPVDPLGFPHAVSEDDTIDGMVIPKGSQVFINIWGMHYDSARFHDPDTFNPERYLGVTQLASELANGDWEKRDHYAYGSGRRLCPGIHLAERSLFIAMAKLLWALRFDAGLDSAGRAIDPDVRVETAYTSGLLICAKKFPCRVTARSRARKDTIMREFGLAETQVFARYSDVKEW
ncbi:Cytochrome P450 [Metarhizium album ARSEF 1941]|uniref:Cytochrome P450 n=1 Tax=Metarhizium album (strain ARSEF 1941) TaxID=1081103 RepID=A0A0B2WKX6_METAS|nr:Cytochrome P450 [Metarhizium album ARSEF 1941]KHN94309.1 Cytochrome P450 [Metarhizium album ARSEF 1941]